MPTWVVLAFSFCTAVCIFGLFVTHHMAKTAEFQRDLIIRLVKALDESTSVLEEACNALPHLLAHIAKLESEADALKEEIEGLEYELLEERDE